MLQSLRVLHGGRCRKRDDWLIAKPGGMTGQNKARLSLKLSESFCALSWPPAHATTVDAVRIRHAALSLPGRSAGTGVRTLS